MLTITLLIIVPILIMLLIFTPISIGVGVPLIGALSSPYIIYALLDSLGIDASFIVYFTPAYWLGVFMDSLRPLLQAILGV